MNEKATGNDVKGENETSWTENPALGGIDPAKLQMLLSLADQAKGKNQNELLSFLMAASSQAQNSQMTFQPSEMDAIINVMKAGKSPAEIQKIDRLCAVLRRYKK